MERIPKYEWPEGFNNSIDSIPSSGFLGFDTETKGLDPYHPNSFLISYAISEAKGIALANVIQHNQTTWDCIMDGSILIELLGNPNITLVGHNIKYDLEWLAMKYPDMPVRCQVFDTMLAQYFLDENQPAHLSDVISNHLNKEHHKGMVNTADLESEALEDVLLYNAYDAEVEMQLLPKMTEKLHRQGVLKLALVANQILPILVKMQTRGVKVDLPKAQANRKKLVEETVAQAITLRELYGAFDPSSPQDLSRMVYGKMKFKPEKFTKTGSGSTDYESLVLLQDQVKDEKQATFLEELIKYKKGMKLLSALYQNVEDKIKYDGRRHARYNLGKQYGESDGGTVTGRLSGDMQQIPRGKEHKGIFIPSEGYAFIDGDFSQLELRVVAYLAQEPVMLQAFEEGKDIHSAVMADLMQIDYDELNRALDDSNHLKHSEWKELRVAIKRINFGIVYGVAADRLRRLLKVEMGIDWTKERCDDLIKQWLKKYHRIAVFLNDVKAHANHYKYVRNIFGQKRRLPDAMETQWGMDSSIRIAASRAQRQAGNFVVQSVASWIMLFGMILVDEYLQRRPELEGGMVIQVHDSGTWEVCKNRKNTDPINAGYNLGYVSSNDLKQVAVDIQYIMEVRVKEYIKQIFGVDFTVPLKFETKILERWG